MLSPTVVVAVETERPAALVAEPPLSEGSRVASWRVRGGAGFEVLDGCVATAIPGWVEDMRPAAMGRTRGLLVVTAERIAGGPLEVTDVEGHVRFARAGKTVGRGRTFLGFAEREAFGCFVLCQPAADVDPCRAIVAGATLEGSAEPPPAGLALRGATWAVHHARLAVLAMALTAALLGAFAVVTRRKPRSFG